MGSGALGVARPLSRLLPPALAAALLGALASLVFGSGPIPVSTSQVAQYVNAVIQPIGTIVTPATGGLTPSAAPDAQYVNGVLQPISTIVTPATGGLTPSAAPDAQYVNGVLQPISTTAAPASQPITPSSEVVAPDVETPTTASQTLTRSDFTVSGLVAGLPSTTAEQPLTPSDFTVSGTTAGLPSTTAEQPLTPSDFAVSGTTAGLPSTASTQTLTPSSFTVAAVVSSGDAPATSAVVAGTTPLTPSTASPGHYVNGVLAASSTAGLAVCKGVDVSGADTDGDGLTNEQEALLGTNPCDPDTDGDGCTDGTEVQTAAGSETTGGLRNPLNQWDYFDVNGDKHIDVPNDLLPVILAYLQGPLDPGGPGPLYTAAKDRGPAKTGAQFAWQRTGPDGHIDVPNDLLPIILQYLHTCK